MNNKKIQQKYEDVYKQEKGFFFSRFINGKLMLSDMDKRLKNVLRNANFSFRGAQLRECLTNVVNHEPNSLQALNGSSTLYIIERKIKWLN